MTTTHEHSIALADKWNLYYHLPQDKSWELSSYKTVMVDINRADTLLSLVNGVSHNIIKYCMLFVMRKGITPMWEDKLNRNGGCFSYKVPNKTVPEVWNALFLSLCGESLTVLPTNSKLVNGITVSPKKNFCVVKIWMRDCTVQDPEAIIDIPGLPRQGCLFKNHAPEF